MPSTIIAGIDSEALATATGRCWNEWFSVINQREADSESSIDREAVLVEAGVEHPWWRRKILDGFDKIHGHGEVGEASTAYEVGVQRVLPMQPADLWMMLLSPAGQAIWLGPAPGFELEEGTSFETPDGISGTVETFDRGSRLSLTWQLPAWDDPSTLHILLTRPVEGDTNTVLRFHQVGLPSGDVKDTTEMQWTAVLNDLQALFSGH